MKPISKDKADLISISVIDFDTSGKKIENGKIPQPQSDYYKALIEESAFQVGDHGVQPGDMEISWLDENLIKKGQEFIRRHFFSVMFAHFLSLLLIFAFKSGRAVLLRTGESHKKDNSLTRYLSTILHIKLWYETDFIVKKSKSSQDVYAVRKMHRASAANYEKAKTPAVYMESAQEVLLNAIKEDCKQIETPNTPWDLLVENPQVPVSQFDMVITQFCFLGFINLHPTMFGVYDEDGEGMSGFVHIWAVLGRLLGIDDKYNLALHAKDRVAYNQIWNDIFMAGFKAIDKFSIVMWDALIYGLSFYIYFLRLNSVTLYLLTEVAKLPTAKNVSGLCSYYDKFTYNLMKLGISLTRFNVIRILMNNTVRFWLWVGTVRYMKGGQHLTPPSEARKGKEIVVQTV